MRVAVPKETAAGERRVALVPDAVARLAPGFEVAVERGAGAARGLPRRGVRRGGRELVERRPLRDASRVVTRRASRRADEVAGSREGAVLIGFLAAAHRHRAGSSGWPPRRRRRSRWSRSRASRARSRWTRSPRRHRRRLQGGAARGRPAAEVLPDADDRRRARCRPRRCSCSAPASPGCRRSRPRGGSARSSRRSTCGRSCGSRSRASARRSSTSASSARRPRAATRAS